MTGKDAYPTPRKKNDRQGCLSDTKEKNDRQDASPTKEEE
jgi:hypothetical protein